MDSLPPYYRCPPTHVFVFFTMFILLCSVILSSVSILSSAGTERNDLPMIGILAQDLRSPPPNKTSYIAASYVKFLESAGARVVPIMINQTDEEYTALFKSLNGVLFPGGGASLTSSGYARAAKIFYDLAIEANSRGDYFPIWGTCLGFEELTYLTAGELLLSRTNTTGVSLPLNFTADYMQGKLFQGFPADILQALATEPLTENSHKWSILTETHNNNDKLKKFYRILSTNTDGELEFVSTFEAYNYPIYGTQWHPEKNPFEWTKPYINHSPIGIKMTFYMADFFVNEARKSLHRFASAEEEREVLIYNYSPVYTARTENSSFEQKYYF